MTHTRRRRLLRSCASFLAATVAALPGLAHAGGLRGSVRFAGPPPAPDWLRPSSDLATCGSAPRRSQALVVSSSGGVQNAVLFLAHERLEGWRSSTTFQLDQRQCTFVPRVLIVPPGATIEILNSDGILHNFHTQSRLNPPLNFAQPAFVKLRRLSFEYPEFVPVKCDLHGEGLMRAWIVVANHPHYALTDAQGRFYLPGLPPGPHFLEVWHERLGSQRLPVTIGASGDVEVTVTFPPPDSARQP